MVMTCLIDIVLGTENIKAQPATNLELIAPTSKELELALA